LHQVQNNASSLSNQNFSLPTLVSLLATLVVLQHKQVVAVSCLFYPTFVIS